MSTRASKGRLRESLQRKKQKGRAIKALVIVAFGVAFVPMVGFAQEGVSQAERTNVLFASLAEGMLSEEETKGFNVSEISALSGVDGVAAEDGFSEEGFAEECLSLEGRGEVFSAANGSLFGFSSEESPGETFKALANELRSKGWTEVGNGEGPRASFIKDQGEFQWLFLSCSRLADQTSVVVQVRKGA